MVLAFISNSQRESMDHKWPNAVLQNFICNDISVVSIIAADSVRNAAVCLKCSLGDSRRLLCCCKDFAVVT